MDEPRSDIVVVHNPQAMRFEATVDGETSVADYRRVGDYIEFTHTEVPSPQRNQGIARALAREALDYSRANRLRVVPTCPFFRAYIRRNPSYGDIIAVS
jgi:uncharacterized protein